MSGRIRLSRKNGLNPTIPICPYCGEDKNELILTGAAGDKMARKMGRPEGDMPMRTYFEGDYTPCDKCREKGVVVLVLDHEPVKGEKPDIVEAMLLDRKAVPIIVKPKEMADRVLGKGIMAVDRKTAETLKNLVKGNETVKDEEANKNDD